MDKREVTAWFCLATICSGFTILYNMFFAYTVSKSGAVLSGILTNFLPFSLGFCLGYSMIKGRRIFLVHRQARKESLLGMFTGGILFTFCFGIGSLLLF